MDKLADIEFCIIACVIMKPELMTQIRFKKEHMKNHRIIWNFLREFYNKFKNLDVQLMYSMYPNPKEFETLISLVSETYISVGNFDLYQDELIRKREESLKDKITIDKIYELATKLQLREMTVEEFKEKYNIICESIDKTCVDPSKMTDIEQKAKSNINYKGDEKIEIRAFK